MEDMFKEEFKLAGQALLIYAVAVGAYWIFIG